MARLSTAYRLLMEANKLSVTKNRSMAIASPFAVSQMSQIPFYDIFADAKLPLGRTEAMSVPAVARGRHLLCSTIAAFPLKAYKGTDELVPQPAWLYRTSGSTSPQHRMLWTIDDLLFSGSALWAVERGSEQQILDAVRVPQDEWGVNEDGQIEVQGNPVDANSVIYFPGFHEGILNFGGSTIRTAKELEKTVASRAANPIPATEIHQTTDDDMTDEEITDLLAKWRTARQDPSGAVCYTPSSIEVKTHGENSTELLISGRNAAAIDVARLMGIPAAMIDASNVNSTLTYETLQGRAQEFKAFSLDLYLLAAAARLSMDDVTPRGTRIAFDTSELTVTFAPSGAPTED